ncbi:MAG: hypothetical protein JXR58_13145 [Bacteroidales bacterium]|nr:hypothetical protein [Bacteroidales bacterium]
MKIGFFLLIFFAIGFQSLYCQTNTETDQRLLVKYSQEDLDRLTQTQPQLIKYELFRLDNSWYFIDIDLTANKPYPMLFEIDYANKTKGNLVETIDETSFNLFNYYIDPQVDKSIVYQIGNTGKALVIIPEKELAEKFNKSITE